MLQLSWLRIARAFLGGQIPSGYFGTVTDRWSRTLNWAGTTNCAALRKFSLPSKARQRTTHAGECADL